MDEMKMYEAILEILEKNGSATIPLIWQEMSKRSPQLITGNTKAVEQSCIKSFINSKNEVFLVKDGLVSIRPEKNPVMMTVVLHGYPGPELRVKIDFNRYRFSYFEWHLDSRAAAPLSMKRHGSVEDFKKQLYTFDIWTWKEDYQADGIVVDGTSWSVKLETKGLTYESGGLDSFPADWKKFSRAISTLIGKPFLC
jgi:hypothetical protein